MAKRFVKIKQTFYTTAIMDIEKDEHLSSVVERIRTHCEEDPAGYEGVICQGGDIEVEILPKKPCRADEDAFECID